MRLSKMAAGAALSLGIALGMTVAAPAARADTLGEALVGAYNTSGLLDQNRALLRAADEDVAQAMAALMPVIEWSASSTYSDPVPRGADNVSTTAQITAALTLYDGGRNRLAIDIQKELVLATRASLIGVEQEVLLRAVEAYMNVRRETEFVALRRNNLNLITQELRAAQDRFEVGEVTRTDVSLAEARLAGSRSQLAAAEGALERAVEEYLAVVGSRPGALPPAPPAPIAGSEAEATELALRQHPAIREAQHNVTAAEIAIRRAEAALRPSVSISGSVVTDDEFETSQRLGLQVGGPIYRGGALSSQIRSAMAQRDAARAGLLVTTRQIAQNVGNAYSFLSVARASREAVGEQVAAAQVAFEGVREEAALGARTTLDVLNAEQELLDARANQIAAQVDETIASYAVLQSMGLLTADHLDLPVQTYDPVAYYNLVKDAPVALSP